MTDGVAVRRAGRFGPRGPARTISRAVGLAVVMFEAVAAFWLVMLALVALSGYTAIKTTKIKKRCVSWSPSTSI